jgi:hypothetical protein
VQDLQSLDARAGEIAVSSIKSPFRRGAECRIYNRAWLAKIRHPMKALLLLALVISSMATAALATETIPVTTAAAPAADAAGLAEKLQNPVADLVSVQFQNNFDFGVGENNGTLYLLNFQPVIPLHLNADWNYIVRPVLPFISTSNVFGPGYVSGLGDMEIETFFSPSAPGPFDIIWGIGPTAILPTATQKKLGGDVMTLGPSGVALWQKNGWTVGALVTQNWRVAGPGDYNATYFQPFLSHTFKTATTLSVDSESSYDWLDEQWTISFNSGVSQVFKMGKIPVQIALELQYYAESPVPGQQWGFRVNFTPMFPD